MAGRRRLGAEQPGIPEGQPPAALRPSSHQMPSSMDGGMALILEGEDDPLELAQSRLAVLARLAPYRLIRHVIASREPINHETYFDTTVCAALFIDISGFSKMTEKLVAKNGLEGAEQLARHLNINLGRIVDRLIAWFDHQESPPHHDLHGRLSDQESLFFPAFSDADIIKFAGDAALCIFPVVEGGPDLATQTLRATQLSLECITALEAENYVSSFPPSLPFSLHFPPLLQKKRHREFHSVLL